MSYAIRYSPETPEFEAKYGGYNDMPPGLNEITVEEFNIKFHGSSYMWDAVSHRQVVDRKNPRNAMRSFTLYIGHDGNGLAVECEYGKGKDGQYGYQFKFYTLTLCAHEYKELSMKECREQGLYHGGNCYHVSKCSKCGMINAYDSSD